MDELKVILLNNVDNLDLDFFEGENTWEFDIDDYSFTVVYSFDESTYYDADNDDDIDTGSKLTLISIIAYNNLNDEEINVEIDDDIRKLFNDYYQSRLDDYDGMNDDYDDF